jgi:EpsI family protein
MIRSTAFRVYFVAALLPLTFGGAHLVQTALELPDVDMPDWTFKEMPMQLGSWQGRDVSLDPKIANATGAKVIVDRAYQDDMGHQVSIHTAMFDNPGEGVLHSPLNCYRSNGWERSELSTSDLQISDTLTIPVSVSVFHKGPERVMVAYWYQLGEHVLFGRWDLGLKVRWALAGKPKWPALIKVMVQIPVSDINDARSALLSFTEQVAKWENLPKHRNGKGMLGTSEKSVNKK